MERETSDPSDNFKGLQTPQSYSSGGGLHPFRGSIRPQQTFIAKVSTSKQQAGFYSIYFHVLKKDGDLRPILDLRRLKHSLENPDLQDAPDKAHSRVNRAGRVVHYDRLKRCVLPRPNLSGTSAVPPFCHSGTSLSISPRVFRVMAAALPLSKEWFKDYALPGQLASKCPISPASRKGYCPTFSLIQSHSVSRFPGQLEKERPESKA